MRFLTKHGPEGPESGTLCERCFHSASIDFSMVSVRPADPQETCSYCGQDDLGNPFAMFFSEPHHGPQYGPVYRHWLAGLAPRQYQYYLDNYVEAHIREAFYR